MPEKSYALKCIVSAYRIRMRIFSGNDDQFIEFLSYLMGSERLQKLNAVNQVRPTSLATIHEQHLLVENKKLSILDLCVTKQLFDVITSYKSMNHISHQKKVTPFSPVPLSRFRQCGKNFNSKLKRNYWRHIYLL